MVRVHDYVYKSESDASSIVTRDAGTFLPLGDLYRSLYIYDTATSFPLSGDAGDIFEVGLCKIYKGNSDDFINKANYEKYKNQILPNSIAWKWLTSADKKVGVMIAGNLGRPGGACVSYSGNKDGKGAKFAGGMTFTWTDHYNATTQEESTLSCLGLFYDNRHQLQNKLFARSREYGMRPPTGKDTDYEVKIDANGSAEEGWTTYPGIMKVNVFTEEIVGIRPSQKCKNIYEREYGFNLKAPDLKVQRPTRDCYLSFVAGPNASKEPFKYRDVGPYARGVGGCNLYKLATVPRTRSLAAMDYDIFQKYIRQAIAGSLYAMSRNGVKRAIIAPISTGLYAGNHKSEIIKEGVFFNIAVDAVIYLEKKGVTFEEILIQIP